MSSLDKRIKQMAVDARMNEVQEMLDGKMFDICVLHKLREVLSEVEHKDVQALSILHCVDWGDLPSGAKVVVSTKIEELFGDALRACGVILNNPTVGGYELEKLL